MALRSRRAWRTGAAGGGARRKRRAWRTGVAESGASAALETEAAPQSADGNVFVGTCSFMKTPAQEYAKRFEVVELNTTFHDRGDTTYEEQAARYAALGLYVVVKVSGFATHDVGLQRPREWLGWLRSKYKPFADEGVLLAAFWQLPPSFEKTPENLNRVGILGAALRAQRQGRVWRSLPHVFEFRHSSWYGDAEVAETMRRHGLSMVKMHLINDTNWAGDLASGWHGLDDMKMAKKQEADAKDGDATKAKRYAASPDAPDPEAFSYFRLFGNEGRSIGKYSKAELRQIVSLALQSVGQEPTRTAVVVFGQGDAPSQALDNAKQLSALLEEERAHPGQMLVEGEDEEAREEVSLVSGTVVSQTRGWDGRVILDVGGQKGYVGQRHLRKRGLMLKVGTVLDSLRVEGKEKGWLVLSVCGAALHSKAEKEQDGKDEYREQQLAAAGA